MLAADVPAVGRNTSFLPKRLLEKHLMSAATKCTTPVVGGRPFAGARGAVGSIPSRTVGIGSARGPGSQVSTPSCGAVIDRQDASLAKQSAEYGLPNRAIKRKRNSRLRRPSRSAYGKR
jgi:hypothetical protein